METYSLRAHFFPVYDHDALILGLYHRVVVDPVDPDWGSGSLISEFGRILNIIVIEGFRNVLIIIW